MRTPCWAVLRGSGSRGRVAKRRACLGVPERIGGRGQKFDVVVGSTSSVCWNSEKTTVRSEHPCNAPRQDESIYAPELAVLLCIALPRLHASPAPLYIAPQSCNAADTAPPAAAEAIARAPSALPLLHRLETAHPTYACTLSRT